MENTIVAAIVNQGWLRITDSLISSFKFLVTDFAIGDQGHDPQNPRMPRAIDPAQVELNAGRPVLFGPAPLTSAVREPPYCSAYTFDLARGVAVGDWSQINLIATVLASPGELPDGTPLPGVGTQFLFAVANRPLVIRADVDQNTYRIVIRI